MGRGRGYFGLIKSEVYKKNSDFSMRIYNSGKGAGVTLRRLHLKKKSSTSLPPTDETSGKHLGVKYRFVTTFPPLSQYFAPQIVSAKDSSRFCSPFFFHFHAVSAKLMPNKRLAPPLGNPGPATEGD